MNVAEKMGFKVPTTFKEQALGKVSFLKRAAEAHERFANDPKQTKKQRAWQAELARQARAAIATLETKLAADAA